MWEHRHLASPVRIAADPTGQNGRVEIQNWQDFRDLGWLRAHWALTLDGDPVADGELTLPALAPGGRMTVELDGWPDQADRPGEARVTVRFRTAKAAPWAPAGFEVCAGQLRMPAVEMGTGAGTDDAVDPPAGTWSSVVSVDDDGRLVHRDLAGPPALSLWRAPTDNDRIGGMAAAWAAAGLDRLERHQVKVERDDGGGAVRVSAEVRTHGGHLIRHDQTFHPLAGDGVRVEETVTVPAALADLARIGTVLETVAGFEDLTWYGTGPHETYPDRKASGLLGRWSDTVTSHIVPYVRPQETGGRADTRWLTLGDGHGRALRIELDERRQVSVSHFRAEDLATATHDVELVARPESVVHLDAAHRGVGTASCGPDTLPGYLVGPGTYSWSWTLRPVAEA
jgi:beta-galactosidase